MREAPGPSGGAAKHARLHEPHIAPLAAFAGWLRDEGTADGTAAAVPDFDPADGGTAAEVLFVLESPGPSAVRSGFVSQDKPDQTAAHIKRLLRQVGLARGRVCIWNADPFCLSTPEENRTPTLAAVERAGPFTIALVEGLPRLGVIVFCGAKARHQSLFLNEVASVPKVMTYHPSLRATNQPKVRAQLEKAFAETRRIVGPGA